MTSKKINIFVAIVFCFILSICACKGGGDDKIVITGNSHVITPIFFGMHIHRPEQPTPWPVNGVGSYRTWDAKVRWADLQPTPNLWHFDRLDFLISGAKKYNLDILVPLGMPPSWASSKPNEMSAYNLGEAATPKDMFLWRQYVRKVAERYKGKVKAYEIWNEPNLQKFYSGSVDEAVNLTCEAYIILKSIDNEIKLVSPSPTGANGIPWLETFLRLGGGKCVDVIGFHFYNSHLDPESHIILHKRIRKLMLDNDLANAELWNTETGWLIQSSETKMDPNTVGFKSTDRALSPDDTLSVIPRALILHAALGVSRFYWYALDNDMMGLLQRNGKPKRAWDAYLDTFSLLNDRTIGNCVSTQKDKWSCDLILDGRSIASVCWQSKLHLSSNSKLPVGAKYNVIGDGLFNSVSYIEANTAYQNGRVVTVWR